MEARRVAMGDWMGDPDVTLGWGWGWWIALPTLDVTLEFRRTGCCEGASENHALPGHRRKTRTYSLARRKDTTAVDASNGTHGEAAQRLWKLASVHVTFAFGLSKTPIVWPRLMRQRYSS